MFDTGLGSGNALIMKTMVSWLIANTDSTLLDSQGYGWGHMGVQFTSGGNRTKKSFL